MLNFFSCREERERKRGVGDDDDEKILFIVLSGCSSLSPSFLPSSAKEVKKITDATAETAKRSETHVDYVNR